jgi:hypothetical protein
LQTQLDAHTSAASLHSLLDRLVSANHAGLAPENKQHLQRLFLHCLRAYDTATDMGQATRERLNVLAAHVHAFAQKESRLVAE